MLFPYTMPYLYIYGGKQLIWSPGSIPIETMVEKEETESALNPATTSQLLDNPVWFALTSQQGDLALGGSLAKRYPPTVGAIAAVSNLERAAFDELAALIEPGEVIYLVGTESSDIEPYLPPSLKVNHQMPLLQMIYSGSASLFKSKSNITRLSSADVPEMLNLVALAKPGPFLKDSYKMGRYFGIRRQDQLVAMIGERLGLPGYREISTVCTHPDFWGRGYASQLVSHLVSLHLDEGNTSFLHVLPGNERTKALYHRLGFVERRHIPLVGIQRVERAA